jgi:hypothetical protein
MPSIVRFLENAQTPRDLIPGLTALAVVTSGGNDNYDVTAGSPGSGHWVGLWGLDVDRWPQYADLDLQHPQTAADVAHELTRHTKCLDWTPAYAAGWWRPYYGPAKMAMSRQPFHEVRHAPVAVVMHEASGLNRARLSERNGATYG